MSDTALKVLATVAGLAGLGFAGAAFVGAGTRKPNPADPLDVQVDRWLASGEMRVDPPKYLTMFAKHAREIGQPEPVGEMLGCGGFGCVWPTTQSGVAMKATKDESEPAIVRRLMSDENSPPGFVRYTHMSDVNGFTLLWREEVEPYQGEGFPVLDAYNTYSQTAHRILEEIEYEDEWNELIGILAGQMSGWDIRPTTKGKGPVPVMIGRKLIDLSDWEPSEDYTEMKGMRFIAAWRAALLTAQKMRKSKDLRPVADAILWAMSKGIMLCDVESYNLGWVKLHAKPTLVIFDPGYTVDVPVISTT